MTLYLLGEPERVITSQQTEHHCYDPELETGRTLHTTNPVLSNLIVKASCLGGDKGWIA